MPGRELSLWKVMEIVCEYWFSVREERKATRAGEDVISAAPLHSAPTDCVEQRNLVFYEPVLT